MKLLFISHLKNDCFVEQTPDIEITEVVDNRSMIDIFTDKKLTVTDYDLLLLHPETRTDPGWRSAPIPTLIFSKGFRKPIIKETVVFVPREIVEKNWLFIIDEFRRCRSLVEVLTTLQNMERETL